MTSVQNHKIKYRIINLYGTNEEKSFEIFQSTILDVQCLSTSVLWGVPTGRESLTQVSFDSPRMKGMGSSS